MNARRKTRASSLDGMPSLDAGAEKTMPAFVDVRIARRYVNAPHAIDFSRAKGISESAARVLAECRRPLPLDGLESLSGAVSRAVSRHRARISFGGLTDLPEKTVRILSSHHGKILFNGLKTLTPEAAAALSRHHGTLAFRGLPRLSGDAARDAARATAANHGALLFNGIRTRPSSRDSPVERIDPPFGCRRACAFQPLLEPTTERPLGTPTRTCRRPED